MRHIVHTPLFKAVVSIGLHKGYTIETISSAEVLKHLQTLQDELIQQKGIYLGANCYESVLVLSGQNEPHVNLHFIDYPKFPLEGEVFKQAVVMIARLCWKYLRILIQELKVDGNYSMLFLNKFNCFLKIVKYED